MALDAEDVNKLSPEVRGDSPEVKGDDAAAFTAEAKAASNHVRNGTLLTLLTRSITPLCTKGNRFCQVIWICGTVE